MKPFKTGSRKIRQGNRKARTGTTECRRPNDRGFLLITTALAIAVLSVFSLAIFAYGYTFVRSNERNQSRMVGFNIAEAGLDAIIFQLAQPDPSQPNNFSTFPCPQNTTYANNSASGRASGCSTGYVSMNTNTGGGTVFQGGYEAWVDDSNVPARYRRIEIAGHSPVNGNSGTAGDCPAAGPGVRGYECRSLVAYVELDDTLFEYAVFSENDLIFNGNATLVDSYDSALGAYGGGNIGNDGDVGSNGSLAAGDIVLNGNPVIQGGILENVGIECDAQAVNPNVASMGKLKKLQDYTLPDVPFNTYHYDSLDVGGQATLTIDPSDGNPVTIYVDGYFKMVGDRIVATVPVTIYVGGQVDFGGNGLVTADNDPTNFLLIATGSAPINITGGNSFYGGIFAPDSDVDIGGSVNVYGAIFSTDFEHNGGPGLHYDEAMRDVSLPCTIVRLRSWREENTLLS